MRNLHVANAYSTVFPSTFQGCHTPNFFPRAIFMLLMPFPHYSTTLHVTSLSVTQISLSFKIAQSLKRLSSIAYLDLAVAPRLSSLRKIRTQDCVLRIQ
jgi:hypothetical protein